MNEPLEEPSQLDLIKDLFVNIAENLDVSQPLLWGYYFTNDTEEGLQKAAEALASQGYTVVDLYASDPDEDEEPNPDTAWWLHVEKVEVHTPESLFARGEELERLADEFELTCYDGMDVGEVEDDSAEPE